MSKARIRIPKVNAVLKKFLDSVEFQNLRNRLAGMSITESELLVRNLYLAILHREPEPAALTGLSTQIAGGVDLNAVLKGFLDSVEFQNLRNRLAGMSITESELLVRNLYLAILHREPEPAALTWLSTQVAGGVDLNAVLKGFLDSVEFQNLWDRLVALAFPPGHFYSPIVNVAEIAEEFRRRVAQPTPTALSGIAIDIAAQQELWQRMLTFLQEIPFPVQRTEGFRYYFENPHYSYGDASILYALLRLYRPARLIEIGSGYSSACSMDTIDRYLAGQVKVTLIEPHAELVRERLGEEAIRRTTLYEMRVQEVPLSLFGALRNGDFLFIDSTHVMKTGSDVCHELFEILPHLAPGVLIHFHDMLWPFEYREDWVLSENRSWNEIYAMRAFLMFNDNFEIVFFNDYFRKFNECLIRDTYPLFLKNSGASLWLRKF
jgi:predicted O-methyltransferase YrrM